MHPRRSAIQDLALGIIVGLFAAEGVLAVLMHFQWPPVAVVIASVCAGLAASDVTMRLSFALARLTTLLLFLETLVLGIRAKAMEEFIQAASERRPDKAPRTGKKPAGGPHDN